MRTFLRNLIIGGLAFGVGGALLEDAMLNMNNSSAIWRLNDPIPWIVTAPLFAIAIYYFFKSDKDNENER